jgi:hypothetical protein
MSAANDVRQVDRVGGDGFQGFDEPGAFTRTRRVIVDRLVSRQPMSTVLIRAADQ